MNSRIATCIRSFEDFAMKKVSTDDNGSQILLKKTRTCNSEKMAKTSKKRTSQCHTAL